MRRLPIEQAQAGEILLPQKLERLLHPLGTHRVKTPVQTLGQRLGLFGIAAKDQDFREIRHRRRLQVPRKCCKPFNSRRTGTTGQLYHPDWFSAATVRVKLRLPWNGSPPDESPPLLNRLMAGWR